MFSIMPRKFLYVPLVLIFIITLLVSCNRPYKSGTDQEEIDTSRDPYQRILKTNETLLVETKAGRFILTPVAEYRLAGVVVGRKSYSSDWNGEISPLDLAMAWGKLADPDFRKYVSFSQGNRWYFYRFGSECPLDQSYISTHSSNNHIIPATSNIFRALKIVKRGEKILLEGMLVNVQGTYRGRTVYWNTSLTRQDAGEGSCEILYVTKVKINSDIYE